MISTDIRELDLCNFEGQLTQTIVLPNISWVTYQALLTEMGNHRSARLTYDCGRLTIKMPSKLHEIINRLLARIVNTLTEEFDLEVVDIGSTTLDRKDLDKGAEPDTGFYIKNAAQLTGLDPEIPETLPPDLVIEVDISSPSTQRIQIYQALGISEIWQYTKQQGLRIYHWQANGYVESSVSLAFPRMTVEMLNQFLEQRQTQSENQVIQAVRTWVRQQGSMDYKK